MSRDGGQPGESWERIRPAPRPVRAASAPETVEEPALPPLPEPERPLEATGPVPRPDRSRMDPVILDRAGEREEKRRIRAERQASERNRHVLRMDRWLFRLLLGLGIAAMAGGAWWIVRKNRAGVTYPPPEIQTSEGGLSPGTRAGRLVAAFLAAPDAKAKSAFVCESTRILPLMEQAYASGRLPEADLTLGVPMALAPGLTLVPGRVAGPPEFLLHLLVRERDGGPLLDWEPYEQDISQRFIAFASHPGSPGGDFRLVLERSHSFDSSHEAVEFVRVAPLGSAALLQPVALAAEAVTSITDGLPWNQRRRALVRLEWQTPGNGPPHLVLRKLVHWDFLP